MRALGTLVFALGCSSSFETVTRPEMLLPDAHVVEASGACTAYGGTLATAMAPERVTWLLMDAFPLARVETEKDPATGRSATTLYMSDHAIVQVLAREDASPMLKVRATDRTIIEVARSRTESDTPEVQALYPPLWLAPVSPRVSPSDVWHLLDAP